MSAIMTQLQKSEDMDPKIELRINRNSVKKRISRNKRRIFPIFSTLKQRMKTMFKGL
jgi:hypothetical protein